MLDHKGTVTLETNRLILRRFELGDAAAMFRNWANNAEVTKYLTWEPHGKVEVSRDVLKSWVESYDKPDYYHWAIVYGGEAIGGISVVGMNERYEKCEIGYCIGRAHWGKGIMPEAFTAVINYLFGTVGFHRIEAKHDVENPNSGKVMTKCGLKNEGLERESIKFQCGEWHDTKTYAILRGEWVKGWLK